MDIFLAGMSAELFALACAVTLIAGFVKGAVGFGMPMILISGLGTFLAPDTALAALILPTVVLNVAQGLRQGRQAAVQSVKQFRVFLLVGLVALMGSAQLVNVIPHGVLFALIGVLIVVFTTSQFLGWRMRSVARHRMRAEVLMGSLAGFTGGMSGVWGPPTIAYLTALETPKREHVRIQGVVYALGAIALLVAHIQSGVFNLRTAPLSLALLVPALLGMVLGRQLHDRMNQIVFRKATLLVLTLVALNLIRKGLVG